jgi:hypothetical protein
MRTAPFSLTLQHYLVSYYTVEDVKSGRLMQPSQDARFRNLKPRYDLIHKQNFRVPLADELEVLGRNHGDDRTQSCGYVTEREPPVMFSQGYPTLSTDSAEHCGSRYAMSHPSAAHGQFMLRQRKFGVIPF